VSGDSLLLLYSPDLATADTIGVAAALLPGERITHLVSDASGSGSHALAVGDTAGAIITVRHRDGRVLERIGLEGVPTAVAMHPDGHTLMVATSPGTAETQERSTLHFIPLDAARTAAQAELCDRPARAMVPFRDLDRLYVACEGGDLAELDLRLRTQIRTVRFAEPQDHMSEPCRPAGAGLSSNATLIYVLCGETGTLLYFDRARLTLFDSLVVGGGASGLAMTPNRHQAVVTRPRANEVAILDLRGRRVADRAAFGAPSSSSVSSDGRWAYVIGDEGVLRVDLREMRLLAQPGLGTRATAVAVWPGHTSPIMRW
jgi:DNA-binding beta-propeller fold protein YncE